MSHDFPFEHFLVPDNKQQNPTQFFKDQPSQDFESRSGGPSTTQAEFTGIEKFNDNELGEIQAEIHNQLKSLINSNSYEMYFEENVELTNFSSGQVTFTVPTRFIQQKIEGHYQKELQTALLNILGKNYDVRVETRNSNKTLETSTNERYQETTLDDVTNQRPKSAKQSSFALELTPTKDDQINEIESKYIEHMNDNTWGTLIDPTKTFNNFIVGASNQLAYATATAVAQSPGKEGKYPSLYMHSSSGLGKTHLLHAVANGIRDNYPEMRICLITARNFLKEMIEAIKHNDLGEFQQKYSERVDVLMIDDIHELKKKTGTQEEFFHIFNELYNKGKQLIFTSDKSPQEIDGIEERIKTRLQWGLVVDIQKPDLETRIAILQEKAKELDLFLSDDILTLISSSIKSSIRELEGSLIKLSAYTDVMKVDLDTETVKGLLNIQDSEKERKILLDDVVKSTAKHFNIPLADLKSKSRSKEIAHARHIAMYMGRHHVNATLQEIGHYFGGRDHSTVINGVKKIKEQVKNDQNLSRDLFEIESHL